MAEIPHVLMEYKEAESFISSKLREQYNLKAFCRDHNLLTSYHVILKIKNQMANKQYPLVLLKLFHIFGYDCSLKTYYDLRQYSSKKFIPEDIFNQKQ